MYGEGEGEGYEAPQAQEEMSKKTRQDRRQTRRADRSFKKSGILEQGPIEVSRNRSTKVKLAKDFPPTPVGAAKGRDIPLPKSK